MASEQGSTPSAASRAPLWAGAVVLIAAALWLMRPGERSSAKPRHPEQAAYSNHDQAAPTPPDTAEPTLASAAPPSSGISAAPTDPARNKRITKSAQLAVDQIRMPEDAPPPVRRNFDSPKAELEYLRKKLVSEKQQLAIRQRASEHMTAKMAKLNPKDTEAQENLEQRAQWVESHLLRQQEAVNKVTARIKELGGQP